MAKAIGLSKGMLSQIENGLADTKISHIENAANFLQIDFNEIITTPNKFFTILNSPNSAGITGDNNHLVHDQKVIEVLTKQLEEKDTQIKTKLEIIFKQMNLIETLSA